MKSPSSPNCARAPQASARAGRHMGTLAPEFYDINNRGAAARPGDGRLVRAEGLEPPRLSSLEPKSSASTSFATPAPAEEGTSSSVYKESATRNARAARQGQPGS